MGLSSQRRHRHTFQALGGTVCLEEGAVSEDGWGGPPCSWTPVFAWALHLPVHPLTCSPSPAILLVDPWSWTPSSVLLSTQRHTPAEAGSVALGASGQVRSRDQVTVVERKPPDPRRCDGCPQLAVRLTTQLTPEHLWLFMSCSKDSTGGVNPRCRVDSDPLIRRAPHI